MTHITSIIAILSALLIGAMVPGPSFLVVCKTSLSHSRAHGIGAAVGMGLGATLFASIALAGVAQVLAEVNTASMMLKAVGGLYLLWLAVRIWRDGDQPLSATSLPPDMTRGGRSRSLGRTCALATLTQLSNPKTALIHASIFAALLPAPVPLWEVLVLPPLVFIMETAWYGLVAVVFSQPKPQSLYRRGKRTLDRIAGSMMALLGLRLLSGLFTPRS